MSSQQSYIQDIDESYLKHLKYDDVLFELCEQVKYIINEIQTNCSDSKNNASIDLTSAQKNKLKLAIIGDLMNSQYDFAKEKIKKLEQLKEQENKSSQFGDDWWDQALLEVCMKVEQLHRSQENIS